jgi:hypothetical protein
MTLRTILILTSLAVAAALTACPGPGQQSTPPHPADAPAAQPTDKPGLDFTKIDVGLPSRTLDFIGDKATGLAGARHAGAIYFGTADGGTSHVYRRDLATLERSYIAKVDGLLSASLACTYDGRYLAYARGRLISSYIDDPSVTYPERLALVCRLDTRSGDEQELYDFRDPAWRPFRGDTFSPFIAPEGQQVYTMAYNLDRLMLTRQLSEWLALEADYRERLAKMADTEKTELEKTLRLLLTAPNVLPQLKEQGVAPAETGAITIAERDAMRKLYEGSVKPQAALLIWDDGQRRLLPLTFAEGFTESYHFILAANDKTVLIGAQDLASDPVSPNTIFTVNLQDGSVSELHEYLGAPSTMELDSNAGVLRLAYNPVDTAARKILTETRVMSIPLDGGAVTETKLPGDFMGFLDMTVDGSMIAAQSRDDLDLYLIDVASGNKQLLVKLQADVMGVFIPEDHRNIAYLDNSILYSIAAVADPPTSPDWVDESYFEQYKAPINGFLEALGFTLPAGLIYEWEEKQGLGAHEVAVAIHNPAKPGMLALARYAIDKQRVVSAWFPYGYPFPIDPAMTGKKLDFYGCRDLASKALDRVGWLNAETRQEYHPGPNPLYDGKSASFVVIFRDGYWLGGGEDKQWVLNADATFRVHDADGTIAELSLSELPEVQDQPMTVTLDKAVFSIRNTGEQPIPQDAPVRFDTQEYRLVLANKGTEAFGPAKYNAGMKSRLCYEIDAYIQPEEELIMTSQVDTETGEVLGRLDYQPQNIEPVRKSQ